MCKCQYHKAGVLFTRERLMKIEQSNELCPNCKIKLSIMTAERKDETTGDWLERKSMLCFVCNFASNTTKVISSTETILKPEDK